MNYSISERYKTVIVKFKGNVMGGPDAANFHDELKKLVEDGKSNIIGDLSRVKFMNSSGLGVLITAMTSTRKNGGDFKICGASDRIESLLIVTKLITVFDHYKTLNEAVEAYQSK